MKIINILRENWKWVLLFLFLPTFNGCASSIGLIFPVSLQKNDFNFGSGNIVSYLSFSEIIAKEWIFFLLNFVALFFFLFFFKEYFIRAPKIVQRTFFFFCLYDGILSFFSYFISNSISFPIFFSLNAQIDFFLSFFFLGFIANTETPKEQIDVITNIVFVSAQILWIATVLLIGILLYVLGDVLRMLFQKK